MAKYWYFYWPNMATFYWPNFGTLLRNAWDDDVTESFHVPRFEAKYNKFTIPKINQRNIFHKY